MRLTINLAKELRGRRGKEMVLLLERGRHGRKERRGEGGCRGVYDAVVGGCICFYSCWCDHCEQPVLFVIFWFRLFGLKGRAESR